MRNTDLSVSIEGNNNNISFRFVNTIFRWFFDSFIIQWLNEFSDQTFIIENIYIYLVSFLFFVILGCFMVDIIIIPA